MDSEAKEIKMKQIFSILTNGIEVIQYQIDRKGKFSTCSKVLWMEVDQYRLCCERHRPRIVKRGRGVPHGLYLRDISEIRDGVEAFPFISADTAPDDPDFCFSLVGSEQTISLMLPKGSRDWIVTRLRLITESILVGEERKYRKYKVWENMQLLSDNERKLAQAMTEELQAGVAVLWHDNYITPLKLTFNVSSNCLSIITTETVFGFWTSDKEFTINVSDISEVRPGSHALGFVRTDSTNNDATTVCIVASERSFNLQFDRRDVRDRFVARLFLFVLHHVRPGLLPEQLLPSKDINEHLASAILSPSLVPRSETQEDRGRFLVS